MPALWQRARTPRNDLVGAACYGCRMDDLLGIGEDDRDTITGLPSRERAHARLGNWLARGEPVHAVLVGLKRLDAVNLAYGTAGGDAVLAELAARIRRCAADELTGPFIVTRGAGSSFLVLAAQACSREHWQLFATQLLTVLAFPTTIAGVPLRLTPRAALLRAGTAGDDPAALFARLAEALEPLLAHGSRRLVWADGAAVRGERTAAALEADLLHALAGAQIEVLYQPQIACAGGHLLGAEALARWNHPDLGRIGAGVLFAIAERADQLGPLARHIAARAMADARHWPESLRLSLNVTPGELADPDFAPHVLDLIASSGFDAGRLTLEVTEQVLVSDVAQAAQVLDLLHAAQVRIALDDFGAGFCNFRYLKLLPLDYLKLDRSMIEGAADDPRDRAVLRGIVAMATALGLKVIAEGVEREDQRRLIEEEGCYSWQGFLKATPLCATDFAALF